ncbi:MAG: hypothetical protein PWP76_719 [Candidatus Diapherotrites archaeon]|nr:hypothetical protein [Candidatus Diapherotrites archaeon]
MNPYVEIVRPWQWYKNVVAFLGIFFAGLFLDLHALLSVTITFFALSLASSGVYVINDIIDVEKDRLHPKKRNRPLPSGRISVPAATVYGYALVALALLLAYSVNALVFLSVSALILNTLIYSLFLKRFAFIDVADLALNFLFRTLAGVFAIGVYPSYWIIIIPYFIAVFLALLKRYGELQRTTEARASLQQYDADTLRVLSAVTLGIILVLYTLYVFDSHLPHKTITAVTTLPIAVFTLFRWYNDAMRNPDLAEDAAKMVYDRGFLLGLALWAAVLFAVIYLI